MFDKIFGNDPRVKVINYILINSELEYNKKQLALGANVARSTLNSFIDDLLEKKFLIKNKNKYKLNTNSEYIQILSETQMKLANVRNKALAEDFVEPSRLSDEELDKIFDEEYTFDIDEELDKLEFEENLFNNNLNLITFINNKKEVLNYEYEAK